MEMPIRKNLCHPPWSLKKLNNVNDDLMKVIKIKKIKILRL